MSKKVQNKYTRIPRVRRLEYLIDFLNVVKEHGYDKQMIMQKLAERKRAFEVEKSKALGRGKPFMQKLEVVKNLADDCLKMGVQLSFVKIKESIALSDEGELFLVDKIIQRMIFASKFLNTYYKAAHTFLTISKQLTSEIQVPLERNKLIFNQEASKYGLKIDQTAFEVVRDLLSQVDLMNWYVLRQDGKRYSKVYLTSSLLTRECKGCIDFMHEGQKYFVLPRKANYEEFKHALWEEYLKETSYVPRKPVFYSRLRSRVCYRLRIADRIFDSYANKIIQHDDDYLVIGSGGSLPYSRDDASLLKNLPIKSERAGYIVYIKMDRR
jgi:hypothetical protein